MFKDNVGSCGVTVEHKMYILLLHGTAARAWTAIDLFCYEIYSMWYDIVSEAFWSNHTDFQHWYCLKRIGYDRRDGGQP